MGADCRRGMNFCVNDYLFVKCMVLLANSIKCMNCTVSRALHIVLTISVGN